MADDRLKLLALCIDRRGYLRGARLAEFIGEWEVAVRQLGGPITTDEFAAWWKDSRATAYRRLADFRATFPELGPHGFPHHLMGPLLAQLAESNHPGSVRGVVVT